MNIIAALYTFAVGLIAYDAFMGWLELEIELEQELAHHETLRKMQENQHSSRMKGWD